MKDNLSPYLDSLSFDDVRREQITDPDFNEDNNNHDDDDEKTTEELEPISTVS
jgi:hypothetical protein